jgi:hypothetical protein
MGSIMASGVPLKNAGICPNDRSHSSTERRNKWDLYVNIAGTHQAMPTRGNALVPLLVITNTCRKAAPGISANTAGILPAMHTLAVAQTAHQKRIVIWLKKTVAMFASFVDILLAMHIRVHVIKVLTENTNTCSPPWHSPHGERCRLG